MAHLLASNHLRGNGLSFMVAAALTVVVGCDRKSGGAAGAMGGERPPALVTIVAAEKEDVPVYFDEIGKCVAKEVVEIRAQAAGRIIEVPFKDGSDLHEKDILFQIDPAPYKAAMAQAVAARDQSKAQYALAELDYNRIKDLPSTVVSQQDIDAKKGAKDVAEAQVAAGEAAIQVAQVKLDYCTIKSPLDGRAGTRLVDVGNIVSDLAPQSLLTIQRLDPIYADFTVTENDLTEVRNHMADGTLKVEVKLPTDKAPVLGDLTFLDNSVQDGTGTIKLRATIPNQAKHFWPGQFVRVRLVLYTQKDAPLIPAMAVQTGADGQYVYVVENAGNDLVVRQQPVTPGQHQEDRHVAPGQQPVDKIVVKQGINPGDRVVVMGQMTLMPGAKVREGAPPATQPAATPGTKPASAPTDSRGAK